jgi:subtilisin family serine protease/PKD repeat protein
LKKLASLVLLVFISLAGYGQRRTYVLPDRVQKNQYDASTIIVRFKSDDHTLAKVNKKGKSVISKTKRALPFIDNKAKNIAKPHPLANIYEVELEPGENLFEVINAFLAMDNVEYAEPNFNHRPLFIPNDPEANTTNGKQTYLSIIKAYDAWTLEKGDTSVVIGILDTGIDPNHDEFINQIAYNYNDPINGVDDDNDGLVDNFIGWDIANNDNNPIADTDAHGVQVSGMAAAETNNGIGIAGTGFNSRILPIKVFKSDGNFFRNGYQAIALAADQGCKVINLSWGSPDSYSQFGQDIINYAVLEKDVVIVAAAGNTPELLDFYPASYDNVLSVGASNMTDEKANFSTFSYNIDLMAPGQGIYSATIDNGYVSNVQGTSFSAPLVAGAAALIRARQPSLTAQQVMERIRVTSDNIYTVPVNVPFEGTLGKGRLNMLKALTDNTSPSLRIDTVAYTNGIGPLAYAGDTLLIQLTIKNYLTATKSARATITSLSPYVNLIQDDMDIGSVATLGTFYQSNPYSIMLSDDLPPDEDLVFKVNFEDGIYTDFQYFIIKASPNFVNVGDNLRMTVAGDGDLGYDEDYWYNGIGIEFEEQKILDNIGLIVASSKSAVSDNAPINLNNNTHDHDFTNFNNIKQYSNGFAPIDVRSIFTVEDSIRIEQKSITSSNSNFIIQEYRIVNTGNQTLNNVHVSIFADWNLGIKDFNTADWSGSDKLGYVYSDGLYSGIALISSQDSIYSAINNRNFNGNIADIPSILTDSVKFSHASQGLLKTSAGTANGGNDVSHVVGGTIQNLPVNSAEKVVFTFVAGHSLAELQAALSDARDLYQSYYQNPPVIHVSETCPGEPAIINPGIGTMFDFYQDVELTNLLFSGESFVTPNIAVPTSFYVINKDNAFDSDVFRVIAKPKAVAAAFSAKPDPLLLDEKGKSSVIFTDLSIDGVSWQWNFDNGFTANVKNPNTNYAKKGTYNVALTVTNDLGCQETISQPFVVGNRSNKPDIGNVSICKGEMATLTATNATNLEFYADAELNQLIYAGSSFTSVFQKDSTIYVISKDSTYNSNVKTIKIDVDDVKADFSYSPDLTDLGSAQIVQLNSLSTNQELYYWYINNNLIGVNKNLPFNYEGLTTFEIMQIAESINGCYDTLKQVINTSKIALSAIEKISICKGEDVSINPSGNYLHFYADQNLTQLIHKGSFLQLDSLVSDTTFYVVNNEGLAESDPIIINIEVSDLNAAFTPDVVPLNLYNGNEVLFLSNSINAFNWLWLINGDTVSIVDSPVFTFNDVGSFLIELYITDTLGCTDNTSLNYEVVNITGFDEITGLKIYPNPVNSVLIIENPTALQLQIQLIDNLGRVQISTSGTKFNIDMSSLKDGLYHLRIEQGNKIYWQKIVKQ